MLVVSRRADEAIQIKLADGVDGNLTLNDLFALAFPIAGRNWMDVTAAQGEY